ncbi:MAG TPA: P-loop NTPase [Gemmatimonadales bacterium]
MKFRTYHEVAGTDVSDLAGQVGRQRQHVAKRLESIGRVVAVMSGKGGVGKSYVTAGLALAASARGRSVGVLDADLAGPTVARMLQAAGPLTLDQAGVHPAIGTNGVRVFSTDMLLGDGAPLRWKGEHNEPFVWRGALDAGALREFLSDVVWGPLDLLLVDLPPGTDRLQDLAELVPNLAGVIAVTLPSQESERAVARAMQAAVDAGLRLLGVVENMSGYLCPGCATTSPLFRGDAGQTLALSFGVPLLEQVPFTPSIRPSGRPAVLTAVLP